MLSERTAQAEQRPKLARLGFGEMVRIIASARSSATLAAASPDHELALGTGDIVHSSESCAGWLIQINFADD
jgi:hypothetical protein